MKTTYPSYLKEKNGDLWLTEDERENLSISYRIKNVIFEEQSPFQHVMILDSYDFGRMLVLDGIVQTTARDGYIYNEMLAHVPFCIHPNVKKVLIIGGGDCGVAKEVCKYDQVEQIDMVEIDEIVVKACREYLSEVSGRLADPRVNFIFKDGVQFVKDKINEYDLIIVDSSDPIGPAEVLFEKSFYESLYGALKEDGLMVCQSQSPFFHQEITQQTFSRIRDIFTYAKMYIATVPTYPGGFWSFTIGTKKYLDVNENQLTKKDTFYVNKDVVKSCFSLPPFIQKILS